MARLTELPATSGRRKLTDRTMRGLVALLTLIALVPLVLVIYYLLHKGLSPVLKSGFLSSDPTGSFFLNPGGVRSAIFGTLEMVALASVIAIPIGIGVALYLTEYGKEGRFANLVRYFADVMTGIPSIVFGLFIYVSLVVTKFGGSSFAAWKGSVALALLMVPIVIRSAEVVLTLVPSALREAALALGAPRWRVTFKVVLPTALPGLITGSLLAIARAAGETAPILFVVGAPFAATASLGGQMNTLPVTIYNDVSATNPKLVPVAWGAALTLVLIILILNVVARNYARVTGLFRRLTPTRSSAA